MIRLTIALMSVFLLIISCSKLKEPLASVSHEEGWLEPGSTNFHADKVAVSGALSCRSCHGDDADKGTEDSYCITCHKNYPDVSFPHTVNWLAFDNAESHGEFVKSHSSSLTCNNCHTGTYAIASPCDTCH